MPNTKIEAININTSNQMHNIHLKLPLPKYKKKTKRIFSNLIYIFFIYLYNQSNRN